MPDAVDPTTKSPELALSKEGLPPPFDGERVVLNDRKVYIVPPLTFELIRMVRPLLAEIGDIKNTLTDPNATEKILTVCWCAIQLNYPDLEVTRRVRKSLDDEAVEEQTFVGKNALRQLMDFRNSRDVLAALYDMNGFREQLRRQGASP